MYRGRHKFVRFPYYNLQAFKRKQFVCMKWKTIVKIRYEKRWFFVLEKLYCAAPRLQWFRERIVKTKSRSLEKYFSDETIILYRPRQVANGYINYEYIIIMQYLNGRMTSELPMYLLKGRTLKISIYWGKNAIVYAIRFKYELDTNNKGLKKRGISHKRND